MSLKNLISPECTKLKQNVFWNVFFRSQSDIIRVTLKRNFVKNEFLLKIQCYLQHTYTLNKNYRLFQRLLPIT